MSHFLEKVKVQSLRAGEIVKRLRRFVRKAAPQSSAVDLNELIEDVLAMVQVDARVAEIEIDRSLDASLPQVIADGIQIQQVILNLIRNAMDAVSGIEPPRRQIIISSRFRNSGEAECSVRDFGPGIPEEISDRIFETFYTTKAHGLGMGLAISRSIIESQDGRLWFASVTGAGATFHFTLPLAEGRAI
jgi:C4-dicarboxylate-specific signal transduction histidine kinase